MTQDQRLMALSLWAGVVSFSAILYLTGSLWKAILLGTFVLVSCVLGFGARWLMRASFAIAIVAIAVVLGAPSPDQWGQSLQDARQAFLDWFPFVR
jgi:hypothetical protein